MALAIVVLTSKGLRQAKKIAAAIPKKVIIYCPTKITEGDISVHAFSEPLASIAKDLFAEHQQLLFIMSLGIVVRVIAPYVKDKSSDPAVVVMDEQGLHVISVLSGHLGGANQLTLELAAISGAEPVITTASDLQGKVAIDIIARDAKLKLEPKENIKYLNSALVNNKPAQVFYEEAFQDVSKLKNLISDWAEVLPLEQYKQDGCAAAFLTSKELLLPRKDCLYLRPKSLVLGIGCRAGTTEEEIMYAIKSALKQVARSILSIKKICSIDLKSKEKGLLAAAQSLGVKTEFFAVKRIEDMIQRQFDLSKSSFVLNKIGVEGVCEPAALLGANTAHLILRKTKCPKVTVAIAEDIWQL
ncbi:cobalt-precorrin 5A hydrolase [Bacillota bacterium LX-D]|nr:cobalt-precorrin 5A hydrolase [Bacillota bacterium LX-D]